MYEVSLTVEGYQSSGTANVTSMSMSTGGSTTPPPSGGSNTIVVRARGASGTENIRLTVGGTQVGSWTLGTAMQNYSATTSATGGINVQYTNDATNRDVQVDYITVNGTTRQAESQATNTGVYQNGACGGASSEWLNCNGYIGFGNTPTAGRAALVPAADAAPTSGETLSLYPNPARSSLSLELPAHVTQLSIVDYSGTTVQTIPVAGKRSVKTALNLKPGLYLVRMTHGSKIITRQLSVE